jgi:dipeptidase E
VQEGGFSGALRRYLQKGGIVYGASAGAVLMGKDISTYIEDKYISENEKYGYTDTVGLGLIGNYSVITHFHEGDDYKIKEYFAKREYPIIAIPQGSAVVVRDNSMKIIGDRPVTVFDKKGASGKIELGSELSVQNYGFIG